MPSSLQTPLQTKQETKQNSNLILLVIINGALDIQNVSEPFATSSEVISDIIYGGKCYIDMGIIKQWVGKVKMICT
jgi:hypothetical protein